MDKAQQQGNSIEVRTICKYRECSVDEKPGQIGIVLICLGGGANMALL